MDLVSVFCNTLNINISSVIEVHSSRTRNMGAVCSQVQVHILEELDKE